MNQELARYFDNRNEHGRGDGGLTEPGVPEPVLGAEPSVAQPEGVREPTLPPPPEAGPVGPVDPPAAGAPTVRPNDSGAHRAPEAEAGLGVDAAVTQVLPQVLPDAPQETGAPPRRAAVSAPVWTGAAPPASAAATWAAPAQSAIRRTELVKARRVPPEMGWRKALYLSSFHLINLGAGPAERLLRDQIARAGSNIPGNYQVAVVSAKGGVGKTRVTAGMGTAFGIYRTEPVLAIDANPTYGSLGELIDSSAGASIREFVSDPRLDTYPKARKYTGKNPQGLEVLAGNQNVANPLALSAQLFSDVLAQTRRFYQLSLIDCGGEIEHPVMGSVFNEVDALVIVGTMNYDGAKAAEKTLDWLEARNAHELMRRSVLVLNDAYNCADKRFVTAVTNSLAPRVGTVKTIPWDKHLRDAAEFDFDALQRRTQLAFIDLAATLADGFTTADVER